MNAKPKVIYNESFGLVEIESPHGLTLTPNETYALWLAIGAVLAHLPQPLNPDAP